MSFMVGMRTETSHVSLRPTGQVAVSSTCLPRHSWIPRWAVHEARGLPTDDKGVDLASQLCLGRERSQQDQEERLRPPEGRGQSKLSLRDRPFQSDPRWLTTTIVGTQF